MFKHLQLFFFPFKYFFGGGNTILLLSIENGILNRRRVFRFFTPVIPRALRFWEGASLGGAAASAEPRNLSVWRPSFSEHSPLRFRKLSLLLEARRAQRLLSFSWQESCPCVFAMLTLAG